MPSQRRLNTRQSWYCCCCKDGPFSRDLDEHCTSCLRRKCMNCPNANIKGRKKRNERNESDGSSTRKGQLQEGRKALKSKPGAVAALHLQNSSLGPRNNLDQKNGEALHPHHQGYMHNHGASSNNDDNPDEHQPTPNGPQDDVGTCTRDEYHYALGLSVMPNGEALPIACDGGGNGWDYYLPGAFPTASAGHNGPHAGYLPIQGATTHEALQPIWPPRLTTSHGMPSQPLDYADVVSDLDRNVSLWFAEADSANTVSADSLLGTQANNLGGTGHHGFGPQGDAAIDHTTQVAQSSPSSSSAPSGFIGQDSPDSAAFSIDQYGLDGFQHSPSHPNADIGYAVTPDLFATEASLQLPCTCRNPGNGYDMPGASSQEQSKLNRSGNRSYLYGYYAYPTDGSVSSESAASHLSVPTSPINHPGRTTWRTEKPQSFNESMDSPQRQSEKRAGRKRKRNTNTSSTSFVGPTSPAQNYDPTPMTLLQEDNLVSDMSTRTGLVCHFYKMNPKQHSTCATKTFLTISSLGQHLRLAHSPKGRHYCKACCQFFRSASALKTHADSGVCRPTGGVSVDELPKMSHKHERPASKWNTVWQQLFPHLKRPRSPYPDGNHEIDQFVQFFLRALQRPMPGLVAHDRESIGTLLQCQASRWRTEPGEPLDHALLTGPLTKTGGMLFSRSLRPSKQLAAIDSAMA